MTRLKRHVLKNASGMEVEILNLGARIGQIWCPINEQLVPMLVAYDKAEGFETDEFYLGATCGRVCNRIGGGTFELAGQTYSLDQNDGDNTLHGGTGNLSFQYWEMDLENATSEKVVLSAQSHDMQGGFPGLLKLQVEYCLTDENGLEIHFRANTNKATPVNLTNHAYFSLGEATAKSLEMNVQSEQFLERLGIGVPTGELLSSELVSKDLKTGVNIGELIENSSYQQIQQEQGLDHCFVLLGETSEAKASLSSKTTGIKMDVFTDQPTAQVYTGKFLCGEFVPYQGVCIECHGYVDAVNQPHFPSVILQPDDTYESYIRYQFSETASNR
nr:aldose epimerase family protein [Opacimonas viscosa]